MDGFVPDGDDGSEGHGLSGFTVSLDVFSGPFDALLSLIAGRRLELTEISLSAITDEFLAYVRTLDVASNMDEASAFLDVAAILVEAKSAALLPDSDDGQRDEQSLEALRERDLLFARLVQYRAFKEAAGDFSRRIDRNSGRFAHQPDLDSAVLRSLPSLDWTVTPRDLALLAARVFENAPTQEMSVRQLHVPLVDLHRQSLIVRGMLSRLPRGESLSFERIAAGAANTLEVVARFLSVLVLFKQGKIQFRQEKAFSPLYLRWVATGVDSDASDMMISERDFA
ncbi:MAG: segregation/condensation protein A [Bifidobacterium sp.]|jgi:segregation and condensation protein A|nr:segregation/condensation protein A [Bifidobacterium sp.]MCI1864364.1 segregation/condensation protein A [Bifidobacterium sp.]